MSNAHAKAHVADTSVRQPSSWKDLVVWHEDESYYTLQADDTGESPAHLFLTPTLLADLDDILYRQIRECGRDFRECGESSRLLMRTLAMECRSALLS